jgi:hypothetical protein
VLRLRLRSLLLALLFAAGNFGLPAADVLLDHGLGARHRIPQVHIEQRGGCHDPVEHCVLSRLLSELRLGSPTTAAVLLQARATTAALPVPGAHIAPSLPSTPHRSRAPPPSFA